MNRRDILKTAGLAIVGTALIPFDTFAQNKKSKSDNVQPILSGKRKLGKLEVSPLVWVFKICQELTKLQYQVEKRCVTSFTKHLIMA
jgi:hypothetical protein